MILWFKYKQALYRLLISWVFLFSWIVFSALMLILFEIIFIEMTGSVFLPTLGRTHSIFYLGAASLLSMCFHLILIRMFSKKYPKFKLFWQRMSNGESYEEFCKRKKLDSDDRTGEKKKIT